MKNEAEGIGFGEDAAIIFAGDYLNKLSGEKVERECKQKLDDGYKKLVVDLSATEIVNSIGVSILLGVIDRASNAGAEVVLSDVNENTAQLFDMLGVSRHATVLGAA